MKCRDVIGTIYDIFIIATIGCWKRGTIECIIVYKGGIIDEIK